MNHCEPLLRTGVEHKTGKDEEAVDAEPLESSYEKIRIL